MTFVICLLWFVSIPLWKPFMANVLQFSDVDKLFNLALTLIGFYVFFAVQNMLNAVFYGRGKTQLVLLASTFTNIVYYGIVFILYHCGVWMPTLQGIALMFGLGMAFGCIVTITVFYKWRRQSGCCIRVRN